MLISGVQLYFSAMSNRIIHYGTIFLMICEVELFRMAIKPVIWRMEIGGLCLGRTHE